MRCHVSQPLLTSIAAYTTLWNRYVQVYVEGSTFILCTVMMWCLHWHVSSAAHVPFHYHHHPIPSATLSSSFGYHYCEAWPIARVSPTYVLLAGMCCAT